METKSVALPKLNGLQPTLESTAFKLMEEAGELGEAMGKFRGLSGEDVSLEQEYVVKRIARELLDVAQTAITMMFVLEDDYDVSITQSLADHLDKLIEKGYLNLEENK